jgi:GNAT superfamily N-acetyltransferase
MARIDEWSHSKRLATHGEYTIAFGKRRGFYDKILAIKDNEVVGNITMGVTEGSVSSVIVWPEHKGKGLGLAMYETALKHYGVLRSSTDLSVGSAMLWKLLIEKRGGKLIVPLITNYVVTERVPVDIVSWKKSGNFWWPEVMRSGKKTSLRDILNSKDPAEHTSAGESYYEVRN